MNKNDRLEKVASLAAQLELDGGEVLSGAIEGEFSEPGDITNDQLDELIDELEAKVAESSAPKATTTPRQDPKDKPKKQPEVPDGFDAVVLNGFAITTLAAVKGEGDGFLLRDLDRNPAQAKAKAEALVEKGKIKLKG